MDGVMVCPVKRLRFLIQRLWARWLFTEAARMLPERETGKAAMTLCMDAARACARRLGQHYSERGELESPEDIFYLTLNELEAEPPAKSRRARRSPTLQKLVDNLLMRRPLSKVQEFC